jgi:predicted phosphate transport protein (TIGR00153 family)
MPEIRKSLFGRTKALERQIDEFLDKVSEAGMALEQAVAACLEGAGEDVIEEWFAQIHGIESRGDELRRTIEMALYSEMLIPETRGDVLMLLDGLDNLLDEVESSFIAFMVERPAVPEEWVQALRELTAESVATLESTVLASRAYFRDFAAVRDHLHKVAYHEAEADKIAIRLSRQIFGSDLPLDRKLHLRRMVERVDQLADSADDAGDRLAIYAVKRSI